MTATPEERHLRLGLFGLLVIAAGCSGSGSVDDTPEIVVVIAPKSVALRPGQTQRFSATVGGADDASVRFSVEEAGGGAIGADGLYTAPATAGTYHVVATSVANTGRLDRAAVTVVEAADPCSGVTCSGHGSCTSSGGAPSCACASGYHAQGLDCLLDADPCDGIGCSGHGACLVSGSGAACQCDGGYHAEGLSCVAEVDPCQGVTCSGHGTCAASGGSASCQCDGGYHAQGLSCVADADPCQGVTCSGHGTCSASGPGASCACESGYRAQGLSCVPSPAGDCSSEPMRATGTVYYFCECGAGADGACVAGTNAGSNPCTDPANPCGSGWKARAATIAAGETVALCRGGSFAGDTATTRNPNCRADATCDVRDYTPAAHPEWAADQGRRPKIDGGRLAYLPGGAVTQGYRYLNLQMLGTNTGQGAVFIGTDGSAPNPDHHTDLDFCNVNFDGGDLAFYLGAGAKRVVMRQSQFNDLGQALLGGCTDCVFDSNYLSPTSYLAGTFYYHALYISEHHERMRVTNNEIHGCPAGLAPDTQGTPMIVIHASNSDMLVENNWIECDHPENVTGHNIGIAVGHGQYTNAEQSIFLRGTIRRNWIVNAGIGSGVALGQTVDTIVEDNVLVMPPNADAAAGIRTAEGFGRTGYGDPPVYQGDALNRGTTIRNNTIYFAPNSATHFNVGISTGVEGYGYNVTNNVVYFSNGPSLCFDFSLIARIEVQGAQVGDRLTVDGATYTAVAGNAGAFQWTVGSGPDADVVSAINLAEAVSAQQPSYNVRASPASPLGGGSSVFLYSLREYLDPDDVSAVSVSGAGLILDPQMRSAMYGVLSNNACNGSWGTTYDLARVPLTTSPFVNAPSDLRPAAGSALVDGGTSASTCTVAGVAGQPCFSASAPAAVWNAADRGTPRASPIGIGALLP